MDHVFIDDFNNSKMKVKTHEVQKFHSQPDQQLSLLLYQQAKDTSYCLFIFAVYNGQYDKLMSQDDEGVSNITVKKSYIFYRVDRNRMDSIFHSNGSQIIIQPNDEVMILKNCRHLKPIKFKDIRYY